ncbi:putative uncharacterized protein [Roseburia sp. CAG:303]|nr:putative uncharacterized protein [Roseburia sp. CAG:303]
MNVPREIVLSGKRKSRGQAKCINMGIVDCDLYRMLSGDDTAIRNYNGQYLEEYVWAKDRKKQLDEIKAQKI